MKIPLAEEEVKLIVRASACLNKAYTKAFSTFAAISNPPHISDPRATLSSLKACADMLQEVRRDVGENPYLTEDHLASIVALQETAGVDWLEAQAKLIDKSATALEAGEDAQWLEGMRHDTMGIYSTALGQLKKMFEMVNRKTEILGTVNPGPGKARET